MVPTDAEGPLGDGRGLGSREARAWGQVFAKRGHGWSLEMASNTGGWDVAEEMSASQTGGCKK